MIEVEGINLPKDLKPFRDMPAFCVNRQAGELMSFRDAMRLAAASDGSVFYVPENYSPATAAPAPGAKRSGRKSAN